MKNMPDANQPQGSATPGSPETVPASTTNPAGETEDNKGQGEVTQEMYEALEKKLGEQGAELGGYREFVTSITPVLEKLDANPQLVQAIVDGKIDTDLAQAVVDGKVTVADAAAVTEAAKVVEKEVGKEELESMTPEAIESLIEEKVSATRTEMEEKANLKDFETKTEAFISETADFEKYAEGIDEWLDTHNISDIEVAYYAVKGQMTTKEAKDAAEEAEVERAKELALNASGGASHATTTPDGRPIIDDLVGGPTNPLSRG